MNELALDVLTLLALPRLGVKRAHDLLSRLAGSSGADGKPSDHYARWRAIGGPSLAAETIDQARKSAAQILEECEEKQIAVVPIGNERFPLRLTALADVPLVLYVVGNCDSLLLPRSIAVVGTRSPTDFGAERAEWAGETLAREQMCVVSGLALGCDAHAHAGALKGDGITIAVLAHGLDTISPARNRALAREIVERSGALVSEYPPGTRAFRGNFVQRNRLQIGLAAGLLVIETDVDGGTMHTVGFAREQAKPIACLDHPEDMRSSEQVRGNRALLRDHVASAVSIDGELLAFARSSFELAETRRTSGS